MNDDPLRRALPLAIAVLLIGLTALWACWMTAEHSLAALALPALQIMALALGDGMRRDSGSDRAGAMARSSFRWVVVAVWVSLIAGALLQWPLTSPFPLIASIWPLFALAVWRRPRVSAARRARSPETELEPARQGGAALGGLIER